jgi:hypothetical protein
LGKSGVDGLGQVLGVPWSRSCVLMTSGPLVHEELVGKICQTRSPSVGPSHSKAWMLLKSATQRLNSHMAERDKS